MNLTLSSTNPYVGQRIRLERKRLGLSQETLADDLDVSVNYLGQIERGKRVLSLTMAEKICQYFHFSLDYLYRGISHDQFQEHISYEADPYRELLRLLELCDEQEIRLCLSITKPILVAWRAHSKK